MATSFIENMKTPSRTDAIHPMDWTGLAHAENQLPVPFQLTLENDETLVAEEIVRLLPGKRLVAFGTWQERPVVIKLFFERGQAKRHKERELAGIEILTSTKTPTPKLLWQGSCQKQKIQVLLFEKITDALNLDTLWQEKKGTEELETFMQAIIVELATQHVLGIEQQDLHLKNFLINEKRIYTLDGGSIIQHPNVMPKEASLEHLALFFAQLGVGTESLQNKLFQTYIDARGWLLKKGDRAFLQKAIRKSTEKRWQRYARKIFRNSTTFRRKSSFSSVVLYDRAYQSPEFEELCKNPDNFFQGRDIITLKTGRSSTVVQVKLNNQDIVIKRYNMKSSLHWLRRCLRTSRAANSWSLSQRLRLFGIPTPKPVAFIEKRFLGLRGKSYFIMEFSPGVRADEFFSQYRGHDIHLEVTAERIMTLFLNLAKLKLTHGDLKATNILVHKDQPVILDFDGMMEHPNQPALKRAFKKEIRRFMHNWENMPSVHELFEKLIPRL